MKGGPIHAWDSEYYMARARADALASLPQRMLSEHFHLGSVLQGFTVLMQRVFGISFQVGALGYCKMLLQVLQYIARCSKVLPSGCAQLLQGAFRYTCDHCPSCHCRTLPLS